MFSLTDARGGGRPEGVIVLIHNGTFLERGWIRGADLAATLSVGRELREGLIRMSVSTAHWQGVLQAIISCPVPNGATYEYELVPHTEDPADAAIWHRLLTGGHEAL